MQLQQRCSSPTHFSPLSAIAIRCLQVPQATRGSHAPCTPESCFQRGSQPDPVLGRPLESKAEQSKVAFGDICRRIGCRHRQLDSILFFKITFEPHPQVSPVSYQVCWALGASPSYHCLIPAMPHCMSTTNPRPALAQKDSSNIPQRSCVASVSIPFAYSAHSCRTLAQPDTSPPSSCHGIREVL